MKENWEYKRLGEVCCSKSAIERATKIFESNSEILYIDIASIDNQTNCISSYTRTLMSKAPSRAQQCVKKKDVLVSLVRPNLKNVAMLDEDENNFVASSGFCILRSGEKILPKFIFKFVCSETFTDYLVGLTAGANYPAVREDDVRNALIPIPPLDEQEQVVAELDLLSGVIDKQKAELRELDNLAQSTFYDMFGDPIENPKGWEVNVFGNVCDIICGQDYKSVQDENGEYPVYGSGGIMTRANSYRCPENSVILGRKGNINNPIFVREKFWNVDTAFGIVARPTLNPLYLFFFCKNYDFNRHNVAVTIPSLRRIDILQIGIPVPPLSLQQEFADKITSIEKQKTALTQSIAESQKLLDYTMDKYFG